MGAQTQVGKIRVFFSPRRVAWAFLGGYIHPTEAAPGFRADRSQVCPSQTALGHVRGAGKQERGLAG